MKSAFQIAMEGNTPDGVKHIERELTLYVLLHDLQDIRELATDEETHEQWNVKTDDPNVRMRIRLTDGVEYSATTKEKTRNQFETIETEQLISRDFFEALKKMSKDGYKKTRFNIPVEGKKTIWEVDVFKTASGENSLWVKVDYEFERGDEKLPELPFEYKELIAPDLQEGYEDEIDRLWNREWMKLDGYEET